jgi:hypothetical protein
MSNKDRIFVAIYMRPDTSTSTVSCYSSASNPKPAKFQWGIWIEPENSQGAGTAFHVEDDLNVPYLLYSFDSHFHRDEHKAPPANMLGRLMIGKIPQEQSIRDVERILRKVPLPSDPASSITDTLGWTRTASEDLQQAGLAERFSVDTFVADALIHARQWYAKGGKTIEKINYTWSRTFP